MDLPASVLLHMASVALVDLLDEVDKLTWIDSPDGRFSLLGAYKIACGYEVGTPWNGWKKYGN